MNFWCKCVGMEEPHSTDEHGCIWHKSPECVYCFPDIVAAWLANLDPHDIDHILTEPKDSNG